MKNIFFALLFISTSLWAQDYEKNWNKVIEYESAEKIKSANEEVQKIYGKAKQKGAESEIIKTFFYTSKYLQKLDENAQSKIIANLKKETSELSIPSQSILYYVYAKCLEKHLYQNRYQIRNRTATDSIYSDDFLTWSVSTLETEIKNAYEKSIANEEIIQKTPLLPYESIFDFLKYEDFKDMTVFDFLGSEVVSYYTDKIKNKDLNTKEYENNKDLFFDTSANFSTVSFDFIKDSSLNRILTLYQKLEKNKKTKQTHQFERLVFCKQNLFHDNGYYLHILSTFQKSHLYNEILQKVLFEKAEIYQNTASKKEFPNNNIIAVQLYDSILNLSRSVTYKKAILAKNRITSKNLGLKLLKQIYTKENSRAFINYKNTDNITFSFYRIGQNRFNNEKFNSIQNDSIVALIIKNKIPVKKASYSLENKKDYFPYTTEVLLPQLETGHYLVYMESEQKNDSIRTKAFDYETLTVTSLSLLSHIKNNNIYYQALDRKTGIPIKEVKIQSDDFVVFTDENGKAEAKLPKNAHYYKNDLFATKDNDSLYIKKDYISSFSDKDNDEKTKSKIEFYLDRAIYRPGQTVYYKGIALLQKKDQTNVAPNLLVKVTLQDADDNDIKEIEVITNEFGSFSGEFILPKTGITGDFKIIADEPDGMKKDALYDIKNDEHPFWDNNENRNSEITFKVEEYKRPKFEITFNPIKETYVVNQKISVTGNAKSFSGSSISNSKVTYKIDRKSYRNNRSYYPEEEETIAEGETKTDASGNFTVTFIAEPYDNFTQESLPVFSYTISTSVTDINGETRSNETSVNAGYHSLNLKTELSPIIETGKKETLTLSSENLNHEFVPVKGQLQFYFVGPISNKWKTRSFGDPEIKTIPSIEFEQLFPYEKNTETNSYKETLVLTKFVNTETDKKMLLEFLSLWKTGNYKVVFSAKDLFGSPVENTSQFKLLQSSDKQKPSEELFSIKQINENSKKDGFALIEINSNFGDLHLNSSVFYNNIEYYSTDIQLQDKKARIRIPIKNNFKSGIAIQFQTIFENQHIDKGFPITLFDEVPKLQFEVENLRSKIEPNSKENWVFKIKGTAKNDAEVLASMYDSSLDQFTTKNWQFLDFKKYFNNYASRKSALGFDTSNNSLKYLNDDNNHAAVYEKKNNLLWFGFNFSNPNDYYSKKQYELLLKSGKSKMLPNSKLISGIVTDKQGLPLPGVNVIIKGTERGTQTDFDGSYLIDVAQGQELVFSFMGMKNKNIKVNSKIHNVSLKDDEVQLSEVVVTSAFGIQRKSQSLGYASSSVSSNQEVYLQNTNALQSLAGKISGINVIPSDGTPGSSAKVIIRGMSSVKGNNEALVIIDGVISNADALSKINASDIVATTILKETQASALYGSKGANGALIITTKKVLQELTQVQARKNLNETAFFFPQLKTDKNGKISFSFSSPEALTQWKLRLLAHNKKAVSGYYESSVITQKDLMVIPNFPRFLREKDTLFVSAKIANLTSETKTGMSVLQLFDATTMEAVDAKMMNSNNIRNFTIAPRENTVVTWKIAIPDGLQGVQYKVLAKAGNYSDGEENILPVLTNNILVTESIPIWVRENAKKEYTFENLKNNKSSTLRNHQLTFEYTSNPTWVAIQSLPYLIEFEHECAEQTFARFYANSLASEIINSNPKIATVFETWKKNGNLTSKLEQNEELKSILLAETPWLLDMQNEEEKKKNLAFLFDLDKMKSSQEAIFGKLTQKQKASGGFAWFDGGEENEYITRHILAGFGHLEKLIKNDIFGDRIDEIAKKGIPFIDTKFLEAHKIRTKDTNDKNKLIWLNPYSDLHYLYTRSFYLKENPLPEDLKKVIAVYLQNIKTNWTSYTLYEKGMASLTLNRFGEITVAKDIIEGLKETASNNEDWGMYWIDNKTGWYWYQAPIETQALLIEAFAEVTNDTKSVDAMKIWLLKNRQTKNWPTTKSTTEAVYALLLQGTDWLSVKDNTVIKIGDEELMTKKMSENQKEAETGYLKLTWKADEIKKEMASITIENKSKVPGFGGIYWQYFEALDKIKTSQNGALSVSKELYIRKNKDKVEVLQKITSKNPLNIGDLATVRLVITCKEDMEFVHLKDMRASCFEPIDILSEHKYKDGLGYYMSTKDTATHLFFDNINKGTYVIEYDVRVNNMGNFSNGITTIQSMYAPEYTNHTKGIRVTTKE
ncbi:carboxypeptidase-like regulatory domain-containing protein [Flavobacterium sp.]|uniref:alpha-2-macroglobulin family protein n=1 Tax=Flavobacterium sp. TaxID=239 RepID=UPI003D6A5DFF